eukprot:scaffold23958_cov98-Skeletonema_marinoi.AAC.2
MPSKEAINEDVIKRLGEIKPVNVASDLALAELAGMMRLKKMDTVCFVGDNNRNMAFALCQSCDSHRLCRMTPKHCPHCRQCQLKSSKDKQLQIRRKRNADNRVAADSTVPLSSLLGGHPLNM